MPVKPGRSRKDLIRTGLSEAEATRETKNAFRAAIGGETVQMVDAAGEPVILDDYLFDHLDLDGRERFFPLIPDLLKDPYEIWQSFEKALQTGKVRMRQRYIKFYRDEKKRHLMLVAECQRGSLVGYTFLRGDNPEYFNKQRIGRMVYGK